MRFRPEQHLRRQGDFRAIREQGRRVNCGAFLLCGLRREPASSGPVRAGFVASTSAAGAAVQRNRAKRRLREVFRQHQGAVPAGCDVLLVARSSLNRLASAEIARKFTDACRQLFPAANA